MKILFDARHIKEVYSGLARYTHSILSALIKVNNFNRLDILFDKSENYSTNPLYKDIESKLRSNINFIYVEAPLFKYKHHINISQYVNKSDCDIYFYPHFDMPIFIKKKSVFVIHDLLPLVVDNYILKYKFLKQQFFKNMIAINLAKRNGRCVAVSNSTKNDILRIITQKYANKIDVIYEDSFDDVICIDNKNFKIEEVLNLKYFLYIGDRRPHKNLKEMIDIFVILKNRYHYNGYFIIAGSEKNFDINIDNYIKDIPYVKIIGRVSDKELTLLYKNMDALFFLSKYEGFGLPIIEAAKHNKKIIVSNSSSCGEIAPDSALKVNLELSLEEKVKNVNLYLNNKNKINNKKYLENFSWEKSVKQIFGIL